MTARTIAAVERAALATLDATVQVRRGQGAAGPVGWEPGTFSEIEGSPMPGKIVQAISRANPGQGNDVRTNAKDATLWVPADKQLISGDEVTQVGGDGSAWYVLGQQDASTGRVGTREYTLTRDVRKTDGTG